MINFKKFNNIISLASYFTTDAKCKQTMIESRLSDGVIVCTYCGGHHSVVRMDGKFRCKTCGKNHSCLMGTIFENTKLPLIKWFIACILSVVTRRVSVVIRGRKENRKSKMAEAVDFWRNMIEGTMLIKEDIHPLTRKTMGEELRKMRKI